MQVVGPEIRMVLRAVRGAGRMPVEARLRRLLETALLRDALMVERIEHPDPDFEWRVRFGTLEELRSC